MSNTGKMVAALGYEQEDVGLYITDESGIVIASSDTAPTEEQLDEINARLARPAGDWYAAADIDALVRELDGLLNGPSAAPQAKLCDIVAQLRSRKPAQVEHLAAFERWLPTHLGKKFHPVFDLAKDDSGEYRYDPAATLSKGWLACSEEIGLVVERLKRQRMRSCQIAILKSQELKGCRAELAERNALLGAIAAWSSETRAAVLEAFQAELNESASYAWYDAAIADLMKLVETVPPSAESEVKP